jgi:hypothetical protein
MEVGHCEMSLALSSSTRGVNPTPLTAVIPFVHACHYGWLVAPCRRFR